jgi:hypothetical protein
LSIFIGIFLISNTLFAQQIQQLKPAISNISSIYDAIKLSEEVTWLCGEDGYLQELKNGVYSDVNYPNKRVNMLKFHRHGNTVYIAADKGNLFVFSITSQSWKVYTFEKYANRCFYDLHTSKNGDLFVCGGASKISIGEMVLPNGFLLKVDDLHSQSYEVLYSNKLKFVWSVFGNAQDELLFSNYNGFKSKVYEISGSTISKRHVVKGLVYDHFLINETLFFYGAKNLNYRKHGLVGSYDNGKKKPNFCRTLNQSGFVTNMFKNDSSTYVSTYNGLLFKLNTSKELQVPLSNPNTFSIYSSVNTKEGTLLFGHGGGILKLTE